MNRALPLGDVAAAAERRDQRIAQLAGRLIRTARGGAACEQDAALALALALHVSSSSVASKPADLLAAAADLLARTIPHDLNHGEKA